MEETHRARYEERAWSFHAHSSLHGLTSLVALYTLSFLGFSGGIIT